jgi:hypothetical protein
MTFQQPLNSGQVAILCRIAQYIASNVIRTLKTQEESYTAQHKHNNGGVEKYPCRSVTVQEWAHLFRLLETPTEYI